MPLFSRQRGRPRRVSLDKVQPPDMVGTGNGTHVTGTTPAVLVGVLFAALLVLAVVSGQPPLRFTKGEIVSADVLARMDPVKAKQVTAALAARIDRLREAEGS